MSDMQATSPGADNAGAPDAVNLAALDAAPAAPAAPSATLVVDEIAATMEGRANPGYMVASHPDHDAAVAHVTRLFELQYGTAPAEAPVDLAPEPEPPAPEMFAAEPQPQMEQPPAVDFIPHATAGFLPIGGAYDQMVASVGRQAADRDVADANAHLAVVEQRNPGARQSLQASLAQATPDMRYAVLWIMARAHRLQSERL
ncbi:hypothetical protein [Falsiroseomonas tokyonensis]|uniref:Uncharacterized protein n=1 Tax=Falsiroseomonas tokyonensis TaxID=430521 RepID=A0ABV7C7D2_9PROT|nr:hypothetical protein [Falsiroseomonas tokyonensis]MBU8542033.1 hypothetical protein [Falsiroseomonas tokyonensis]